MLATASVGPVACAGVAAPGSSGGTAGDAGTHAAAADVTAVSVTGAAGAYDFSVTIASDETGCDQYADWWEVLDASGTLLYRRILAHSHPDDQPFTRSGGPVAAQADTALVVRAHMHPGGYVGQVMAGTVDGGFSVSTDHDASFAAEVETAAPQPEGCAF